MAEDASPSRETPIWRSAAGAVLVGAALACFQVWIWNGSRAELFLLLLVYCNVALIFVLEPVSWKSLAFPVQVILNFVLFGIFTAALLSISPPKSSPIGLIFVIAIAGTVVAMTPRDFQLPAKILALIGLVIVMESEFI